MGYMGFGEGDAEWGEIPAYAGMTVMGGIGEEG